MRYTYRQGLVMGTAIGLAIAAVLMFGTVAHMSWNGYSLATAKITEFRIDNADCKLRYVKTIDEKIVLITGFADFHQSLRGGSLTVVDEYSLKHQATWGTKWTPPALQVSDREVARICTESANALNLVNVQLLY